MAYTPTEWQTGDIVTAEKLNKIEGGIEECSSNIPSVSGLVEGSMDTETDIATINKSFNDLVAITQAGVVPFLIVSTEQEITCGNLGLLQYEEDTYTAVFASLSAITAFYSSNPNDLMTLEAAPDNNEDSPQS